jgi:hypothetical protein
MNFKIILTTIYEISAGIILWIVIHYAAANLYPIFCAETGIVGFIKSIFLAQSPHCIAMRWVINTGGDVINRMWLSIAIWLTSKLVLKM